MCVFTCLLSVGVAVWGWPRWSWGRKTGNTGHSFQSKSLDFRVKVLSILTSLGTGVGGAWDRAGWWLVRSWIQRGELPSWLDTEFRVKSRKSFTIKGEEKINTHSPVRVTWHVSVPAGESRLLGPSNGDAVTPETEPEPEPDQYWCWSCDRLSSTDHRRRRIPPVASRWVGGAVWPARRKQNQISISCFKMLSIK